MKVHALLATFGFVAAATAVHAQTAQAPTDPLTGLQNAFGTIVGNAFHAPDRIAATVVPPQASAALAQPLGGALRTSMQIPGAAFAALFIPFDTDLTAPAAPAASQAPASAPRHRRAKAAHRRAAVKPTIG